MKNLLYLIIIFLVSFSVTAQKTISDTILTNRGFLEIFPVLHATFYMKWNGKIIYVDPTGGAQAIANTSKPDLILITDIHGDHLHIPTIKEVMDKKTKIVVTQAVADSLKNAGINDVVVMNNGEQQKVDDIKIEAIPMYNIPQKVGVYHPKGRGNGYILELGGKRIYISGDTEDIEEMRNLTNIDAAFICMNLPYTMDIYQATSAVIEFKPAIVYPYHYRGTNGFSDVKTFKRLVESEVPAIDVRLLKWYPDKKD